MNKFDRKWEENFALFREFLVVHQRLPSSKDTFRDFNVGTWLTNQLRAGRTGILPVSRAQLLAEACHVKDLDTIFRFDHREWDESLLMATWKDRLRPDDIAIDTALSGAALEDCLRRGILSCRAYLDEMETLCACHDRFGDISMFSFPAAPDLFCWGNAQCVFHTQFPNVDFTCFNFYFPIYTPNNSNLFKEDELEALGHKPTFFEAAEAMSAYSRFASRTEMRRAYAELIATLPPQQRAVIGSRHFEGQTYREIGDMMGLTVERIRQIHMSALRKLRHPVKSRRVAPLHPRDAAATTDREEAAAQTKPPRFTDPEIPHGQDAKNISIDSVDWAARAYHCLRRGGIETLGQLASLTFDELIKIRGLGWRTAQEIESKLEEYGLSLSPEPEQQVPQASFLYEEGSVPRKPSLDEQLASARSRTKPASNEGFGGSFGDAFGGSGSGPGGPVGPGDSNQGLGRPELSSEDQSTTYVRKRKPDEPTFYPDR